LAAAALAAAALADNIKPLKDKIFSQLSIFLSFFTKFFFLNTN
jgi:hypothetical protein